MSIEIAPIEGAFAGRVSGIDLSRPLTPDEVAVIEAGMDRHAVLVFRDQSPTRSRWRSPATSARSRTRAAATSPGPRTGACRSA
jgi:alpha-ketoglutarate-dependent 2,4-dichlorophenoxyacetate dioxygenase